MYVHWLVSCSSCIGGVGQTTREEEEQKEQAGRAKQSMSLRVTANEGKITHDHDSGSLAPLGGHDFNTGNAIASQSAMVIKVVQSKSVSNPPIPDADSSRPAPRSVSLPLHPDRKNQPGRVKVGRPAHYVPTGGPRLCIPNPHETDLCA